MRVSLPQTLLAAFLLPCTGGSHALTHERAAKQEPGKSAVGHSAKDDALRQAAMNTAGDPKRGKAIYLSKAARCATCHKVHGQGGEVGPDLSAIGGKLDRTHLIESILDPSAEIPQGYHATIIETKRGQTLTGIVKSESATAVTLLDAEG
jgi:mono/diheme cytochrome c family protein